ncbi:hypothetical protein TNCV_2570471 [Trichonephila clavipes]|nr:hypothetical protein TNCV_2570471 [Trichonephila clavipes]
MATDLVKTRRESLWYILTQRRKEHAPILVASSTDVFSSPISGLFYWMQSKGRIRLDARRKGLCKLMYTVCLEILLPDTAARSRASRGSFVHSVLNVKCDPVQMSVLSGGDNTTCLDMIP